MASPLIGQVFFRAALFTTYYQSTAFLHRHFDVPVGERLPTAAYFIAGAATGVAASLVESPIDLFKSQMQMEIVRSRTLPGYVPAYRGVVDVAQTAWRVGGLRQGVYRGLLATLVRNIPANAAYFGFFELFRDSAARARGETVGALPASVAFACGASAGLLYWATTYPADVVKSTLMGDALDPARRRYASAKGEKGDAQVEVCVMVCEMCNKGTVMVCGMYSGERCHCCR